MGVLTVWFTGAHESGCPIGFDGRSMKFQTGRRAGLRAVKALRWKNRPVVIVESDGKVSMLSAATAAAVTLAIWDEDD